VDPEWKLFTAKAIVQSEATVVPVFFAGQNSRLFQLASHLSLTLRLSLLFHELRNKIGSAVEVRIGAPVPYVELSHIADRRALVEYLRRATYELGANSRPAPAALAACQGRAPASRRRTPAPPTEPRGASRLRAAAAGPA
jgi:putative hemolysin